MKIAVGVNDKKVALDLQQSSEFFIYDILDRDAVKRRVEPSPGNSSPILAAFLKNQCIDVVISACMSKSIQQELKQQKIKQLTGAKGEPDDIIDDYLSWSTKFDEDACIS